MQQFITSTEACALLDRILQTVQTLNRARASLSPVQTRAPAIQERQPPPQPLVFSTPVVGTVVLPQPKEPVIPVLTIKLADLMREGSAARARRQQHNRPPRPTQRTRPKPLRPERDVEVIYRKSYRVAS